MVLEVQVGNMKLNLIAIVVYILINTLLLSVLLQLNPNLDSKYLIAFSVFTALFWPESFLKKEENGNE